MKPLIERRNFREFWLWIATENASTYCPPATEQKEYFMNSGHDMA
jgi:hypothetical protein